MTLAGRTALVTGAGSATGLGNGIAGALAGAGARVVLADIDVDGARRNAVAIGAAASAVAMDVTDEASVVAAVAAPGPHDILPTNPPLPPPHPTRALTPEDAPPPPP